MQMTDWIALISKFWYFRWPEKSVIEIGKALEISSMFNYLKQNLSYGSGYLTVPNSKWLIRSVPFSSEIVGYGY